MFPAIFVWSGAAAAVGWFLYLVSSRKGAVIFVGDSQACIVSQLTTDKNPSRAFLEGETNADVEIRVTCKIGSRVADWNKKIDAVKIDKGDTVFVFLGSNEFDNQPDPTTIVRSILRRGARPIWIGPPRIRGGEGRAPAFIAEKLRKLGVAFFDSRKLDLQQSDGVHPTPEEANRWRAAVLSAAGMGE